MQQKSNGMFFLAVVVAFVFIFSIYLWRRPKAPAPPARKPAPVKKVKKPLPPAVAMKGTIALILDDWGNSVRNLETIEQVNVPLTIAVLPNLAYSTEVAERLHKKGFEIMLHLPMQPQGQTNLEQNTITTAMSRQTVEAIIEQDLADVPYAAGVNNHMGSAATQDTGLMSVVMHNLEKRGLYFVDSYSSPNSVCLSVAGERGVRFIRRDIFIDNTADRSYIRQQLAKLKARAAKTGYAVGIGHDRKLTVEVLREEIPVIAAEGYRFVTVSQLIRERAAR